MSSFYIQNLGTIGNCLRWWRPSGNGYTYNLDEAGVFTEEKARALCAGRPKEDILWPCVEINNLAHFHVDSESLATLVSQKKKRVAELKRTGDTVMEKLKEVL